jgi:hypothetical protein
MIRGFIYSVLLLVLFPSCGEAEAKQKKSAANSAKRIWQSGVYQGNSTLQYTGKAGELVVVGDNTLYTDIVVAAIDSVFGDYMRPYYPPQQYFNQVFMSFERYQKVGKRARNLLIIDIQDSIPKGDPRVIVKKAFYARTQLLTEIFAHDTDDLIDAILEQCPSVFTIYDQQEWYREYIRHKEENNHVARKKLAQQFGITLDIPGQARYESVKSSFARISLPDRSRQMDVKSQGGYSSAKANFIQSGVMIWSLPFRDSSQLNPDYLMRARDTVLKYNAKHEISGVYMGTQDHPAVVPTHRYIKIGDVQGLEFKGLFKFTGRFEPSGGKFWSFHFKHPKKDEIIAISAYLDAPPTMSSAMDLRRLQAIIYSLKIPE